MGILREFKEFLDEYKITGLAVAFIIGTAASALVTALVSDIVMPLISPLLPGGDWQTSILQLGPFKIAWGHFLGAFINFIVIAFVVFLIAKMVFKESKVAKK